MKKKLVRLLFLAGILFTVSGPAAAQIYVKIRPTIPVVVRSERPSRNHVWINEEWQPNGRGYRYSGGRWDTPPRRGYTWRQGYWKHNRRNHTQVWISGSWRNSRGRRG